MKHYLPKVTLFLISVMFVFGVSAQIKVFEDSFESGSLATKNWTQDLSGGSNAWNIGSNVISLVGGGTLSAYEGTQYAYLTATSSQPVKLITPVINLSSLTGSLGLLFHMATPEFSGGLKDSLIIYYRTNTTGAWVQIPTLFTASSAWEQQQINIRDYTSANTVQFAFEYFYGGGRGVAIDALYIDNILLCTPPTDLTAIRVSHESAMLSWNSHITSQAYHLKVSTAPITDFNATANVKDEVIYVQPFSINGLNAETIYYFYIKADCGNSDVSTWSKVGTFKTLCTPVASPYSETFDNYGAGENIFPSCWTKNVIKSGDWTNLLLSSYYIPNCYTAIKYSGTASLRLAAMYNAIATSKRTSRAFAATPAINAADFATQQLVFWFYGTQLNNKLHIGLLSDPNDLSTFEELYVVSPKKINTWEEIILPLRKATNNGKHIAFMVDAADNNAITTVYVDNVIIEPIPLCPRLLTLTLKSEKIGSDTAVLSWPAAAANFNIKISTSSINPTLINGDFYNGTIAGNSYIPRGLSQNTNYYWYVQADCDTDGVGAWSYGALFKTLCSVSVTDGQPYLESFNLYGPNTENRPPCWITGTNSTSSSNNPYCTITNISATASLYFSGSSSAYSYAATPQITGSRLNELQVSFSGHAGNLAYYLEVGVMTDPNDVTTFEPIDTIRVSQINTLYNYRLRFNHYTGNAKHIAFKTGGDITSQFYIDDLVIEKVPACAEPLSLKAKNVTHNSAQLSWNAMSTDNKWRLKVATRPIDPVVSAGDFLDTVVTDNPITVSGLLSSMNYYFYVKNICATDSSAWCYGVSFITRCAPITISKKNSFFEPFDTYGATTSTSSTNVNYPKCWYLGTNYIDKYPFCRSTDYFSKPASLYFIASSSIYSYAATPEITTPINDLQVRFKGRAENLSDFIFVGVMTDPNNHQTFEKIDSISVPKVDTWYDYIVTLGHYAGTGKHIAFKVDSKTSYFMIDDVSIELLSTCVPPVNVHASAMTEGSISVAWTPGKNGTAWDLVYGAPGFNPDDGTPIAVSTTPSYTITGLSEYTQYDIYVRSNCGAVDGMSAWSKLTAWTFKTPVALPYHCDFENQTENNKWTLLNGDQPNKWFIGTATSNGGNSSLYISTDFGSTNTYNIGAVSYTYAFQTVNLVAGEVDVEFDWKAQGEGAYDLLKVFLVPSSIRLVAGESYGMTSSTNTTPPDWIDLTGGLNQTNTWKRLKNRAIVSQSGYYSLVFFWKNDGYAGTQPPAAIDNLSISNKPRRNCDYPKDAFISQLTTNSASVGWETVGQAMSYNIKISDTPIDPEVTVGNIREQNGISATSLLVSGLSAATTYYLYVQADCGDGTPSYWSDAFVFNTNCLPQALPLVEDFKNHGTGIGAYPSCWNSLVIKQGTSLPKGSAYPYEPYCHQGVYYGSDSISLRLYGYYDWLQGFYSKSLAILPEMTGDINSLRLLFNCHSGTAGKPLYIGVLEDALDLSTFEHVATVTLGGWTSKTIDFSNYTGMGRFIAFMVDGDAAKASYYAYIDQVRLDSLGSCFAPINLTASDVTASTARLNWESINPTDTVWQVQVSTIDVGFNTADVDTISSFVVDTIVSGNPELMLTNLVPQTTYYFYVRVACSDGVYSARYPRSVSFETGCGEREMPFTENFDSYNRFTTSLPICWNIGGTYSTKPSIKKDPQATGINSLYLYVYGKVYSYAALPAIAGNLNQAYLNFTVYKKAVADDITIGVMTDPNDFSTFDSITTVSVPAINTKMPVTVPLSAYTGSGKHIAFCANLNVLGEKEIYIDDIYVGKMPITCPEPTNLKVTDVTSKTISLKWHPTSGAAEWEVIVCKNNINPEYSDARYTVTDTTIVLTGLLENTTYDIYVRANCGATNGWGAYQKIIQSTLCQGDGILITETTPYKESFDTYGTGTTAKPTCWITGVGNGASMDYPYCNTTNASAPASLHIYGTSSYYSYAATPAIQTPINQLQVKINARTSNTDYYLLVGVMVNPYDVTSFEVVDTIYMKETGVFDVVATRFNDYTGSGKHIAFMVDGKGSSSFYVDDMQVELIGDCMEPIRGTTFNVMTDRATVAWDAMPNETKWRLKVAPVRFNPENDTVSIIDTLVTTLPFVIDGLNPNTTYYWTAQTICNDSTASRWVNIERFTTKCGFTITEGISLFENFDTYGTALGTVPSCWTISMSNTRSFSCSSSEKYSGIASFYFFNLSDNYQYAATPEIKGEPLKDLQVRFKGYGLINSILVVGVMTDADDLSTFEIIDSINVRQAYTWIDYTVRLSNYTGNAKYIAFKANAKTNTFYMDDLVIEKTPPCAPPLVLRTKEVTDISAKLDWDAMPIDTLWRVKIATNAIDPAVSPADVKDTVVSTHPVTIDDLTPLTTYFYYVQTVCGATPTDWSLAGKFTTQCNPMLITSSNNYVENFDTYSLGATPTCWITRSNDLRAQYPICFTTNYSTPHSLYFYSEASYYCYGATPVIEGVPIDSLQVSFYGRSSSLTSYLLVGIMTDPHDVTTFETIDSLIIPVIDIWSEYTVKLSGYTGTGKHIAFKTGGIKTATNFYMDNLTIRVIPDCPKPLDLTASNITHNGADLDWSASANDTQWRVKIATESISPILANTIAVVVDTVVTSHPVTITGLLPVTNYYYYVQNICTDTTIWSGEGTFLTGYQPFELPFEETFAAVSYPPVYWTCLTGLASDAFQGKALTSTTAGWNRVTTDYGIQDAHINLNIYAGSVKTWMVTPKISLGYNAILSFDLALTKHKSGDPIESTVAQIDDQFMVIVSTDAGLSWQAANATIWNNQPYGDYVYNQIPHQSQSVAIDLSAYTGDTVKIAFYAESTLADADNDLHIGNIRINAANNYSIIDNTCQNYPYNKNGFNIPYSLLRNAGIHTFNRLEASPQGTDSLITLTLTVNPNTVTSLAATVCQGVAYNDNGYNVTSPGLHRRTLIASNGCDSILELTLTVTPAIQTTDAQIITTNDLPYTYRDTIIANATVGTHVYTFRRKTTEGCDSIHTLTLDVAQPVGLDLTTETLFELTPNPVQKGEKVQVVAEFSEADRSGLLVEIFNSTGSCVMRFMPNHYPIIISGLNQSGVYVVRITTGTNKVLHGKVVVK